MGGDGGSVCKAPWIPVAGLDDDTRATKEAARKIREIVLHMSVR